MCGSGGTGRHTIYPYCFSNSLQTSDNKPSTFGLNHFRGTPSDRPVTHRKRRMQAVGAKSGAVIRTGFRAEQNLVEAQRVPGSRASCQFANYSRIFDALCKLGANR
jgi:hypothetical protein